MFTWNCQLPATSILVTMIVKFCCCSYLVALTLQQEQDAPSTQSQHSQYESQAAQTPMQQITEADQEWAEWVLCNYATTHYVISQSKIHVQLKFNCGHDSQFSFSSNMKFWTILILGNWRQVEVILIYVQYSYIKLSLYLLYKGYYLISQLQYNNKQQAKLLFPRLGVHHMKYSIFHVLQFHQV